MPRFETKKFYVFFLFNCCLNLQELVRGGLSFGQTPGVLFSSGITWIEMRRTSLHTLRDFGLGKNKLEDIIEEEVDNFLQYIDYNLINTPITMTTFFHIPILSSLWRIISGKSLKVGDPTIEKLIKLVDLFTNEPGNPLLVLSFNQLWLYKILNGMGMFHNQMAHYELLKYCQEMVDTHKEKHIDGENPLTFIEALLHKIQTNDDMDHPLSKTLGELNLVNALLDIFVAGSDTTSTTLNWAMLFMIQHPEVQTNVRQELCQKIGMKKAKMSERSLIPYTEAVLHEISRKSNILPMSVFHYSNSKFQAGSYEIPQDTIIIPLIGDVMNDPIHFPNPAKFHPERYLQEEENGHLKFVPHPRVIPFGVGKRRCLGEIVARTSLFKFFTAIIQRYKIVSGQMEPIEAESNHGFVQAPMPYKLKFVKI